MISGSVTDLHALVPITFRLPNRSDLATEFIVDTGFTDYLCLPPEAIAVLATGRRPLLGTALLDGHELVVQFRQGRLVTIDDL